MRQWIAASLMIGALVGACAPPAPNVEAPVSDPTPTATAEPTVQEQMNGTWVSDAFTVVIDWDAGTYEGVALGEPFTRSITMEKEYANVVEFRSDGELIVAQMQNDGSMILTKQDDLKIPIIVQRQ